MKQATFFVFALLLGACHDEPAMTFGLNLRVLEGNLPLEQVSSSCVPPGAHGGEITGAGSWPIGEPPPHLFWDANPDAEENVYRLRVYVASELETDGIWWKPSEILAERSYDSTFGESGKQDSFVVNFGEQPYTVEVQGLPSQSTCP